MSHIINFYDRTQLKTINIDVLVESYKDNIFMINIYPILKKELALPDSINFIIYSIQQINGKLVKIDHDGNCRLDEMLELIRTKKVRHFEIYYKTNFHGEQVADMSPCTDIKNSVVISGYKRYINGSGEKVQVGDVEGGAFITVPANSGINGTLSIKTVAVTDDFFSQYGLSSSNNVTRGVGYNPKANSFVNKK
jgi:hypothetical protein